MTLWLVLLFGGQELILKSGDRLAVDHFRRHGDYVLFQRGNDVLSIPASKVSWQQTPEPKETGGWQSVSKQRVDEGEELMIGRLDVRQTSLIDLIRFMADMAGANLYIDGSVKDELVTYRLSNISWRQAMEIILRNAGLDAEVQHGMVSVRTLFEKP